MKNVILSAVAALFLASAAHAESVVDLSANFGVASDYRYRGISQTNVGPEVSGGFDLTTKSGFYAGTWLSNVSSEYYTHGSGIETDFYEGYKKKIVKGVTLDIGNYNDLYTRATNNGISFNTSELYLGASAGPVSAKASYALTNYFGIPNTHGTKYVTVDLSQPVGPVTLIAHAAHTYAAHHVNYDYSDYNVGASYTLPKGFVLTGLYYFNKDIGTGARAYNTVDGRKLYGDNFVVSIKKTF
jgi:uncharacterized protein (TIGR02001 family)